MRNIPKCIPVFYENNPQTGFYTKSPSQPIKEFCMTLPYELRVENTFADTIKINARQIIRGTEKGGAGGYKFFTGIVPIGGSNSFVGNRRYFDKQLGYRTELLLFCFSRDNSKLWVFYFPGYDKRNTRERLAFATEVLPYLISKFVYIYEGVY